MYKLIIASMFLLIALPAYALKLDIKIVKGEYEILSSRQLELKKVDFKLKCSVYSKTRLLGHPIRVHYPETTEGHSLKIISKSDTVTEGKKVTSYKVALDKLASLGPKTYFRSYINACQVIWNVEAINTITGENLAQNGQNLIFTTTFRTEGGSQDISSIFQTAIKTKVFKPGKYSKIKVEFLSEL
jgi:hypothetical protein